MASHIVRWLRGVGYDDAANALAELHVEDAALRGTTPQFYVEHPSSRGVPLTALEALSQEWEKQADDLRRQRGLLTRPRSGYEVLEACADELDALIAAHRPKEEADD